MARPPSSHLGSHSDVSVFMQSRLWPAADLKVLCRPKVGLAPGTRNGVGGIPGRPGHVFNWLAAWCFPSYNHSETISYLES